MTTTVQSQRSGVSLHALVFRSLKRTHDMFISDESTLPADDHNASYLSRNVKAKSEYGLVIEAAKISAKIKQQQNLPLPLPAAGLQPTTTVAQPLLMLTAAGATSSPSINNAVGSQSGSASEIANEMMTASSQGSTNDNVKALLPRKANTMPKPQWHPPWKLKRVISGHTGWVRCLDVEPGNEWFCSGAADRIIKIWDLASGRLKLSLTGHVSAVRAVKVSTRHPYLFSAGEDKMVKCWDLEYNKVIRHYHGHLSAVYCMDLHPTIDVLITAGRDSTARVWDMRTKAQVHCLTGHTNTIASVRCQAAEPQIITGSHDSTIRLWDLAAGKSRCTLTHHKKSVRAVCLHPTLYMFASASPDNIKEWRCPDGEFVQNLSGHNAIVNALTVNPDGVLVSGADNGSLNFWDWKSGFCFQKFDCKPQSGSIDSEAGIFALCYDQSSSRLITAEADKTIKIFKEDDEATEETHPVLWRPEILKKKQY